LYLLFYNNYNIFVQDLCMYNNKKFILAQSLKENVSEGLSSTGKALLETGEMSKVLAQEGIKNVPKFVEDIKSGRIQQYLPTFKNLINRGVDLVEFFAPLQLGDVFVENLLKVLRSKNIKLPKGLMSIKKFDVPDKNVGFLKGLAAGTAGAYGAEAIMSGLEEMKGSLNIYKDYHSDFNKILLTILTLLPKNQEVKNRITTLYNNGNVGLQLLQKNRQTKAATYNVKVAIKGEANWGSYLHNFLSGAAGGAAATKTWQGALLSGLGDAFYDIGTDLYYQAQDNDYKATALAKELNDKASTMASQLLKYKDKDKTIELFVMFFMMNVQEFETYMRTNVYKPSTSKLNPDYYRAIIDKKLGRNK